MDNARVAAYRDLAEEWAVRETASRLIREGSDELHAAVEALGAVLQRPRPDLKPDLVDLRLVVHLRDESGAIVERVITVELKDVSPRAPEPADRAEPSQEAVGDEHDKAVVIIREDEPSTGTSSAATTNAENSGALDPELPLTERVRRWFYSHPRTQASVRRLQEELNAGAETVEDYVSTEGVRLALVVVKKSEPRIIQVTRKSHMYVPEDAEAVGDDEAEAAS
jgi:hypothetical protein